MAADGISLAANGHSERAGQPGHGGAALACGAALALTMGAGPAAESSASTNRSGGTDLAKRLEKDGRMTKQLHVRGHVCAGLPTIDIVGHADAATTTIFTPGSSKYPPSRLKMTSRSPSFRSVPSAT